MESKIVIENCNNVIRGEISIKHNQLNIKYGPNGIGKSTISEAIFSKSQNDSDRLNKLIPFDYSLNNKAPKVSDVNFSVVRVFDEKYVDKYMFESHDEFFKNSFKVFIKTDEIDKLSDEINDMLSEIQKMFTENLEVKEFYELLLTFVNVVKFNDNGAVKKAGGIKEFLQGNGAGFNRYDELDAYRKYYDREIVKVIKWAKWRNEGSNEIVDNSCPFCMQELDNNIANENRIISNVFKNSALSFASTLLEFVKKATSIGFMKDNVLNDVSDYVGIPSKSHELESILEKIATETKYIINKINVINAMRPMNLSRDSINNISDVLEGMLIEENVITNCYSTVKAKEFVQDVNCKINALKNKAGIIKGLFNKQERILEGIIKNRESDINEFFLIAGFPYKFKLRKSGENSSVASICPISNEEIDVMNPKEHLSWGERNAFSLVMFMFEAISDNADLVILDDPISSFDNNKKFAIIRRLFDNRKASFKGKSVILFTHDMQPLIDYVYERSFSSMGLTTKVSAVMVQNNNGNIIEKTIEKQDLLNITELTRKICMDEKENMAVRVVNLRKYVELTYYDYVSKPVYHILSNIIHGRSAPLDRDGNELKQETIDEGMLEIKQYGVKNSYCELLEMLTPENLYKIINTGSDYETIIAIRLLFEREENLLLDLRRKYPWTSKFLNETNHVENDYVFQLNPKDYFVIPESYKNDLSRFIKEKLNFDLV